MALHSLAVGASLLASTLRGWRGSMGSMKARQPEKLLELYDIEACPYCRLVREALTELDLDAKIYPCPKRGQRFRPKAKDIGGKMQFPLLIDPNTGTKLYESADIVDYLWRTYRGRPARRSLRPLAVGTSMLASAARIERGMRVRASKAPAQPLELFSFESSPYSRLVRERLCELEIPYTLRSFGKAIAKDIGPPWVRTKFFPDEPILGRNRLRMHAMTGRLQVPYLIDPNTGRALYESAEILRYLDDTYAA